MSEAIGTREFAEKYGVTQATVSKWCREGKIPNCNQDGKGSPWHIPKDAVPPVGYKRRKIFKETYGTTVNNYLISKRITRAKQLLRFTDMTVDEVGVSVGMGDANYFSRMFRKVEGISPREYRKQW